jgi:hypothetical protein
MDGGGDPERQQALEQYKNKLLESREWESKLKALRMDIKGLQNDFETTEDNIKALQSVGANIVQLSSKHPLVQDMLWGAVQRSTRPS